MKGLKLPAESHLVSRQLDINQILKDRNFPRREWEIRVVIFFFIQIYITGTDSGGVMLETEWNLLTKTIRYFPWETRMT